MPRTSRGALTLAEEQPRGRAARVLAGVVGVLVVGVLGVAGYQGFQRVVHTLSSQRCQVSAGGATYTWAPDQSSNAAAITAIAVKRGLPPRAASIALATAMQESKVRNVRFGDRDSLGLFQQRPSQGWGTAEQILDPEYSTNTFYDALVEVDGYTEMDIAEAAQEVQRSAAGSAYAQHEGQARATASVLSGQTSAGIGCALRDPEAPGDAEDLAALLRKDFGLAGEVDGATVTVRSDGDLPWAVASWAVARATDTGAVRVTLDRYRWERSMADTSLTFTRLDADDSGAGDPGHVVIDLATS
ncbi:hypothetical protein JQN72_12815 [Phycicoccus sp. CSK15P-2]|uniref:hypothetical protein n=1 Tax=Phycicoccus sp. CSK15P-2 TaxID=2807627 RepID=UPI00194F5B7B|nr:hypothetical protein [Phycicoccus sp. CSK15P-2]MBM6405123.1 hypothetical protein [Phycicoccus sp. CSK15P-2]